jgi:hypothetical protein
MKIVYFMYIPSNREDQKKGYEHRTLNVQHPILNKAFYLFYLVPMGWL